MGSNGLVLADFVLPEWREAEQRAEAQTQALQQAERELLNCGRNSRLAVRSPEANDKGTGLPHGRPAPLVGGYDQGSAQIGEIGRDQCAVALLAGERHRIQRLAVASDLEMHMRSGGGPGCPDGTDYLTLADRLSL